MAEMAPALEGAGGGRPGSVKILKMFTLLFVCFHM